MDESRPGGWTPPGSSEPPPPPPPPEAMPDGWSAIERERPADWQPPAAPPSRGGKWIIGLVAGVVLLAVLAVVGLITLRAGGDPVVDEPRQTATTPDNDGEQAATPRDRELAAVLSTIDASERRMISFQQRGLAALEADPEGFGDAVSDEAADAADDLTDLYEDLELHARDGADLDGVRSIRDSYLVHLQAWIDYVEAVEDDPVLLRRDNQGSDPYWDEIARSADVFVEAVETDLPDDAPRELVARAEFILERGFRGGGGDDGALV